MKNAIKKLTNDVMSRGVRGLGVAALTVVATLAIGQKDSGDVLNIVADIVSFASLGGILYLISTDSLRGLRFSKQACYAVIIAGTLWLMALVHAVANPNQPLFQAIKQSGPDSSATVLSVEMAPIVLATLLCLALLVGGLIAYAVGKRRKDVKGMKKTDLFK